MTNTDDIDIALLRQKISTLETHLTEAERQRDSTITERDNWQALAAAADADKRKAQDNTDKVRLLYGEAMDALKERSDEVDALRHDIARHVAIASEQATEIEQLRALLTEAHSAAVHVRVMSNELRARIRAALVATEPTQEPVAWLSGRTVDAFAAPGYETCEPSDYGAFPVYAHPAPQQTQEPVCNPTLTVCPRCNNDIHKCDGAFSIAEPEPTQEPVVWANMKNIQSDHFLGIVGVHEVRTQKVNGYYDAPLYAHPAPPQTQELSWGNRLHRNLNGLGEDDHDRRAEHFTQQWLDGLTVGPLNRNSIKAALAEHFADCARPAPEPTQEQPVAWMATWITDAGTTQTCVGIDQADVRRHVGNVPVFPLYARPPQTPMTDEQLKDLWIKYGATVPNLIRAVERHHNIGPARGEKK